MIAAPYRCIACDSPPQRGRRLRNDTQLLRCPTCGLQWWDFSSTNPAALYDRDYFQSDHVTHGYDDYAALEPGIRRTARARLRSLERLRDANTNHALFEFGCGTGVFLEEATARGWQVRGAEISNYAADRARERGFTILDANTCSPALAPNSLDCIVLWDVIEHLPAPHDTLRSLGNALRTNGLLALSTGDVGALAARLTGARWHLYNLPEHLFFFTVAALRRLLTRVGCEVLAVRRDVNWVPLAYIAERLFKRAPRIKRYATRAAPRWVVPATLGDVVAIYARKRANTSAQSNGKDA